MKNYFILSNNTNFYSDVSVVEKNKRINCKESDMFMLTKKDLCADFCEKITKIYTLNTIDQVKELVKDATVYDYTGIETIIRIKEQVMTFNQYKNIKA